MASVKPIPQGMHSITPHMVTKGALQAIQFYKKAFGAREIGPPHMTPTGTVMHAVLQIGDSRVMLADEFPGSCVRSPQSLGGTPIVLNIYVPDVDAVWKQATDAGATVLYPLANQFWGDRYGQLQDPFGHVWALATHVEDVTPAEMEERAKAAFAKMCK